MSADDLRTLAATYRQQGREADAAAVDIMAEEAARLARYQERGPIDDTEAQPDPQPRSYQAVTEAGTAWTLPGIEPPPANAPIAWRQAYAFILQRHALHAVDEARHNPTPDTIGNARRILFYLNNFGQEAVHDIAL